MKSIYGNSEIAFNHLKGRKFYGEVKEIILTPFKSHEKGILFKTWIHGGEHPYLCSYTTLKSLFECELLKEQTT
jgi:hypothetical protein